MKRLRFFGTSSRHVSAGKMLPLISIILASQLVSPPLNATTTRTQYESPLEISEPSPLDIYIERLAFLESSGRETVQIIDSNDQWSRGCLQFQDATFEEQTNKYGLSGNIMDCLLQKRLAKAMLSDNPRYIRHWFHSGKRLGLPPVP